MRTGRTSCEMPGLYVEGDGVYFHRGGRGLPFELFMRLRREGRSRCLVAMEGLMTRARRMSKPSGEAHAPVTSSVVLELYRRACRLGCFRDDGYLVVDGDGEVVGSGASQQEADIEASRLRGGVDSVGESGGGRRFCVVVVSEGSPVRVGGGGT